MTGLRGLPPGRAGRTWLVRRLAAARRSSDLLDRRLLILRGQRSVFEQRTGDARTKVELLAAQAERSALRTALVAGEDALGFAAPPPTATVDITWSALIGARFPSEADVRLPEQPRDAHVPPSASAVVATAAYRSLVVAVVDYAVLTAALRVVDDEVATTGLRLRAIEDHWIPRMEQARAAVELMLAENENGEAVRLRWAAARRDATRESSRADR